MTAFAAVWAYAGLHHRAPVAAMVVLAVGLAAVVAVLLRLRNIPTGPDEGGRDARKALWIIVAVELVAIEIALNVAIKMRLEPLILPIIAIVVGAHFFPLARVFRAPLFIGSGAAIVLWGGAMLALGLHTDVETWTGLGVAIALAATAVLRLRS